MSREGISIATCNPEVLFNLAIICSFVCFCNQNPSTSKDGSARAPTDSIPTGQTKYKQACVDSMLVFYNALIPNSQILVEQPFYVPEIGSPVPLSPASFWTRLINTIRLIKTEDVSPEAVDDYENGQTFSDLRGLGKIPGKIEPYARGELSIPDTVIVHERHAPATPENIQAVGEVKFPPDKWGERQYRNAVRIAGGDDNVQTLTPESDSCNCDGEDQRLKQEAGQAAKVVAAKQAEAKKNVEEMIPLVKLANLAAALAKRNPVGAVINGIFSASPAY